MTTILSTVLRPSSRRLSLKPSSPSSLSSRLCLAAGRARNKASFSYHQCSSSFLLSQDIWKGKRGDVTKSFTDGHIAFNRTNRFLRDLSPTNGHRSLSSSNSSVGTDSIDLADPYCNIPPHIAERAGMTPKLYQRPPHPLHTIQSQIYDYFGSEFDQIDSLSPVVSTESNFDSLLIPNDHVSRSKSDTYYMTPKTCLRTHTSAHQMELLLKGHTKFLCTGDVYRRDDIDKSHYPIFHQMEGVKVFPDTATSEEVMEDLQTTLEGLAKHLFGSETECRWVDEYFPFTHPSTELEIMYDGEWMEVLGCGVMRPEILEASGIQSSKAWAFGLGLERLAMILFNIPDIRLFWSDDSRFWNQFEEKTVTQFQPYSKYPPCFKDVSFWILEEDQYDTQDLLDITRQVAGDLVEEVELVDEFVHPKTQRTSKCFRITYRSMDRSLTNQEIDVLQEDLRDRIQKELPIELR